MNLSVSVSASIPMCETVSSMCSVPVCLLLGDCLSVPHKGLRSVFIEQQRKHHVAEGMGNFIEPFNRIFYKGLSPWLQVIPTDSDNKHHC